MQILDWLSNSTLWAIIGVLATLVGGWFAYRQLGQSKRDVRCELIAVVPLVSVQQQLRNAIGDRVHCTLSGKEVHDLTGLVAADEAG